MTEFLLSHFVKGYPEVNDPQVRARCGNLAGLVGICCNLLLSAGKFLAGLLTGSVAISADAVNNLSDASSSIITLLGFRLAARPADDEHPYGHGRTEYLSGLAVSVMILLIGAELAKTSIQKILSPEPITTGMVSILILAASILVKFWMAITRIRNGTERIRLMITPRASWALGLGRIPFFAQTTSRIPRGIPIT